MLKILLAFTLAILSFPAQDATPTKEKLIGTWKLVSAKITTDKGDVHDSWGPNPIGFLTYTPDGRMSAILTFSNRKPISNNDFISAPTAERAEAFATSTAYAGHFTLIGDKVTHHVEAATTPNDLDANLERVIVKLDADQLILRVAKPYLRGGMMVRSQELLWQRLK
jgi:hypothetical protein